MSRTEVDGVAGFVTSLDGLQFETVATLSPDALESPGAPFILAVRTAPEYADGHWPGAT